MIKHGKCIKTILARLIIALFAVALIACSSDDAPDISGTSFEGINGDKLYLKLVNTNDTPIRSLTRNSSATIKATVLNEDDDPVSGLVVNFSSDLGTIDPESATALTDSNGDAVLSLMTDDQIGAGLVNASVDIGDETLQVSYGFSVSGGAVVDPGDGDTDGDTDGDVSPVSESISGSIEFVSASPNYITLRNTGGSGLSEFSIVSFKLIGTDGLPMEGKSVTFSLSQDIGGIGIDPVTATSNRQGIVSTTVQSGTVPTSIRITAAAQMTDLGGTATEIFTQSDNLVVSTGIPDQNSMSLSADILNPEAFDLDGTEVNVVARLADHFNNWVPDGTTIYFTTEGGSIEPSCETVEGACTVKWISQSPKPSDHRVTILATAIGNESFQDTDSDGVYTLADGEPFTDVNRNGIFDEAFDDANGNGVFDEPFTDTDGNTIYDLGEPFVDHNNNGRWDGGAGADETGETSFTDSNNGDGIYAGSGLMPDGELAFIFDANSDGLFDGPGFADLGDPYVDENENGRYDIGEIYLDTNSDGMYNITGDQKYNGILCQTDNNCSSDKTIHIRDSLVLIMSGSVPVVTFVDAADSSIPITQPVDVSGGGSQSIRAYISDEAYQLLPAGTAITVSASTGKVTGATSVEILNSNQDYSQSKYNIVFTISDSDPAEGDVGDIKLTITLPSGTSYFYSIAVIT